MSDSPTTSSPTTTPSTGQCNGVPSTGWSCCSTATQCALGGGDCDIDSECAGDLICGRDNCLNDFPSVGSNWGTLADCCMGKYYYRPLYIYIFFFSSAADYCIGKLFHWN